MNLAGVDLNLLVTLDALLREQNVTKAAKAVGLSQPAMSNALSRLRKLFDDPLFVRTPEGMLPTLRAEGLAAPLRAALRQIDEAVLHRGAFDPARAELTINIASADYQQLVLLPALMERLAQVAPRIRLHFTTPSERMPINDLYLGRIDLMLGVQTEGQVMQAGIVRAPLMEESYLCAVRNGHPALAGKGTKARLSLARYAALDHMLISPHGGMSGVVDDTLAAHGHTRRVALAVPHFALAPWILMRTDFILTLPERAARQYAAYLPLRLIQPPVEVPNFMLHMFWHERTQADPAHRWFRQLVREVGEQN